MRTCQALRHHGAKPLLDHGVSLATHTHFVSFLEFMLSDEQFRFLHFHTLEIVSSPVRSSKAIEALYGLITHPLLSIHTLALLDAEMTLKVSPPLAGSSTADRRPYHPLPFFAALSALTTLTHLAVSDCGPLTSAFLRALRAPLESATLDFLPRGPAMAWAALPAYCRGDTDPVTLLRACAGSLRTLRGTGFGAAATPSGHEGKNEEEIVYPHVRVVEATYVPWLLESGGRHAEGALPHTARYARAFPRLTRLALSSTAEDGGASTGAGAVWEDAGRVAARREALVALRVANRAALARCGEGVWEGIEEVCGGLGTLYALALVREVRRVVVEGGVGSAEQWMLRAVLRDARPAALVATFVGAQETFGTSAVRGTALSLAEGTARLVEMELVVKFEAGEGNTDVSVVLVSGMIEKTRR